MFNYQFVKAKRLIIKKLNYAPIFYNLKNYLEIGFLSPIYNAGLTRSISSKEG